MRLKGKPSDRPQPSHFLLARDSGRLYTWQASNVIFMKSRSEGLFEERDWRYLSSLQDELLEALSQKINTEVAALLSVPNLSESEKRRAVYRHVRDRDKDVADCFNDLRRSTLPIQALFWRKHGLLRDAHIEKLSVAAAACIREVYPKEQ